MYCDQMFIIKRVILSFGVTEEYILGYVRTGENAERVTATLDQELFEAESYGSDEELIEDWREELGKLLGEAEAYRRLPISGGFHHHPPKEYLEEKNREAREAFLKEKYHTFKELKELC